MSHRLKDSQSGVREVVRDDEDTELWEEMTIGAERLAECPPEHRSRY